MKVITIAAALLLANPLCTTAQQNTAPTRADEYVEQIIQNLIAPPQLASKTTQAVKERLIGESVWQFSTDTITGVQVATAIDTTWYAYTRNRGSYWDPQFSSNWFSIASPGAPIGFAAGVGYANYVRNDHPSILADLRVSRTIGSPGFDSIYHTYSIDNDVVTQFYYSSYPGYAYREFTVNDYDATGNIIKQTVYTSPTQDTIRTLRHLVYNATGVPIIDSAINNSALTIADNSKYVYSYNSAGAIAALAYYTSPVSAPINWVLTYNYIFDYYDFGKIRKITWGIYPFVNLDSFGWTPDHKIANFRSHISEYSYPSRFVMVNNVSSRDQFTDTSLRYRYDMTTGDTFGIWRLVYSNDEYRNVTCIKQLGDYTSSRLTDQLFFQTNYYYEKYDTTKNPAPGSAVITVYPVPVSSTLNILFTGITQATPFSLRLIDMAGRVAVKSDVLYTTAPIGIPMNNLASGVYFLEAINSDTHQRYIEKVVKY